MENRECIGYGSFGRVFALMLGVGTRAWNVGFLDDAMIAGTACDAFTGKDGAYFLCSSLLTGCTGRVPL